MEPLEKALAPAKVGSPGLLVPFPFLPAASRKDENLQSERVPLHAHVEGEREKQPSDPYCM